MSKKPNIKRALLLSALCMILCVSMLVGSTFAWFTDTVSTGTNKIVAGSLDIELFKLDPMDMFTNLEDVKAVDITNSNTPLFGESINWEPGYTAVANLRVDNVGTLAVKAKAVLVAKGNVGKLAEVIDVYVDNGPIRITNGEESARDLLEGMAWGSITIPGAEKVGTLKEVLENETIINSKLGKEDVFKPGESAYIAIALKMREDANNDYQEQEAGAFDIRISAAQATVESDSYDNLYDELAEYETPGTIITEGNITLPDDETLVISGGTVNDYKLIEDSGAGITINDANFKGTAVVWGAGGTVTINGGNYEATALVVVDSVTAPIIVNGGYFKLDSIDASTGGNVTINGGTFTCDPSGFVATGKTATNNGDGTWTVA